MRDYAHTHIFEMQLTRYGYSLTELSGDRIVKYGGEYSCVCLSVCKCVRGCVFPHKVVVTAAHAACTPVACNCELAKTHHNNIVKATTTTSLRTILSLTAVFLLAGRLFVWRLHSLHQLLPSASSQVARGRGVCGGRRPGGYYGAVGKSDTC